MRRKNRNVSVIIPTLNPGPYFGILVDFLKPYFREIIIGVDSKSDKEAFKYANSLNCRTEWVSNDDGAFVEAMLEMFIPLCSNDWVLRLDDDELISLGLVDFCNKILPGLDVDAVGIHRKWCRLGSETLFEYSIYPSYHFDWQWRLFRKDKTGSRPEMHTPGIVFPSETKAPLDSFIVHLDWVYHSYDERRNKVESYQKLNADLGFEDYYLYEDIPDADSYFTPVWEKDFDKWTSRIKMVAA